jgi:curli production assembly/transport component CsgF
MDHMKILYNVLVFFLLLAGVKGVAQDFVYTPKNPAFGGNPYNYSWLLSSAQAQNTHTDESYLYEQTKTDPMKDFAESLNQQILSQLARKIIANLVCRSGAKETD